VALSQTRAEAVHFVQYAAVVLVLPGPLRVRLALATALGVVDEGFQATVLYPEQALDWKDVVFDGLGAVGGGLGVWSWRG
jgi:VanZ family protein